MKHIMFGGFDYALRYEMDQNAVYQGIDYFVDNDPELIGTTYLGKEIRSPETLLREKKGEYLVLIGSIIYRTEIAFQLMDMGLEKEKDFQWAISFCGDKECPRLYRHVEWKDREKNANSLRIVENDEFALSRLKAAVRLVDFEKYDTLIDLGAANERVRPFLPEGITYIPVDYIRYSDETVLCDLNNYQFPESENDPERTCIFSIANIGYCHDWKWYLRMAASTGNGLILGCNDFVRISREFRRIQWGGANALFDHEIICYLLQLGFDLKDAFDFRLRTTCYKFEKRQVKAKHEI